MKIVPHPFVLQEKERELIERERQASLREYHLDSMLMSITERERKLRIKLSKTHLLIFFSGLAGFFMGASLSLLVF